MTADQNIMGEIVSSGDRPYRLAPNWKASQTEVAAFDVFNRALVQHINISRVEGDRVSLDSLPVMPVQERQEALRRKIKGATDYSHTLLPIHNGFTLGALSLVGIFKSVARNFDMPNDAIRPALKLLLESKCQN